jgi:hypothetical protein
MKINNKGQGLAFFGMEVIITLFVLILIYAALDQPIKETILPMGASMATNVSDYNNTLGKIEAGWNMAPWVIIGSCFVFLVFVALMQGRQQ